MNAARLQEDYLTCSLCSNPFSQPKTLPCLHNYCKACLSAYIENVMSGGRHSSFSCPDCRKKIYVPDPSKAINRWAAQFPTNFTLSGMIEAIAEEAESKGKALDLVKAAKERRGGREDQGSPQTATKSPKKGHLQREGSASSVISSEASDAASQLHQLQTNIEKERRDLDSTLNRMDQILATQQQKLERSFEKVYTLIEGRKAQLLEELSNNFVEEKDRLEQTRQSFANDLESLKSCAELLHSVKDKPVSDGAAMDMLEAIKDQAREIEARQTQVVPRTIKFEQTLEAGRSLLNLVDELGRITISTVGEMARDGGSKNDSREGSRLGSRQGSLRSPASNSFDADGAQAVRPGKILAKPRFLTAISTKNTQGQIQQVYDITVLPSGIAVMTAYESPNLLAARKFGNNYKIYSQLQLDSQPKCITTIAPFFVAVVGSSCIYLVSVDDKQMALKKTVHTGKDYYGIAAYSESSLILSCQKPACIDFVGLNGFISETIDRDHTTGTILLKYPQFLTTTKDGIIFVTDLSRSPRLICLNNAGKVRFQYPAEEANSLQVPQGVCCDSQGHIYIVDRKACKVTLLTPAGEKVKDILTAEDGVTDPCAIAIDEEDNVYITNEFNEILLFKIR